MAAQRLSALQRRILQSLWTDRERSRSAVSTSHLELVRSLEADKGSISRSLTKLETRGLVVIGRTLGGRAESVHLTSEGLEMVSEIAGKLLLRRRARINSRLQAGLEPCLSALHGDTVRIRSVGMGGSKMARNTRWQRCRDQLVHRAQCLRSGLIRIGTRGITWGRRVIAGGRNGVHTLWRRGFKSLRTAWNRGQKVVGSVPKAWFIGGVVVIAFVVAVDLVVWSPKRQVAEVGDYAKRLELEDKARGTAAQILAALGIAVGLYFTWRRVAAAEQTVQVATEGQITERFTRAIDQLGATDERGGKRLELRLGGIYALERIARDSEKDHWPIMEVLTAYVRANAPWKEAAQTQQEQSPSAVVRPSDDASQEPTSPSQLTPDTDIQAILTVIGRRARRYGKGEDKRLDLHGTNMRRAHLIEAHLEGAHLIRAHLEGAHLIEAHLEGADLLRAHLEGADLLEAHLERADLLRAHLEGADLLRAHLEGADLLRAHGLTPEQLASAHTDAETRLPDYLIAAQEADDQV